MLVLVLVLFLVVSAMLIVAAATSWCLGAAAVFSVGIICWYYMLTLGEASLVPLNILVTIS